MKMSRIFFYHLLPIPFTGVFNKIKSKEFILFRFEAVKWSKVKSSLGQRAPGWLSRLNVCLWLRS